MPEETTDQRLNRLYTKYNITDADALPKPKKPKKPKKTSIFTRALRFIQGKPKKKVMPRAKPKVKTTWPTGITSQKQFEDLMGINTKK